MNNPNKMKFETPDLTVRNVEKIAKLFPGVVTEGKVNFDLLRSILGDKVYGDEAYEFTWVGKRAAIAEGAKPIRKTLRPVIEDEKTPTGVDSTGKPYCSSGSRNWDTTENLYIEGDNLDVLKLLQESYLGKIKMIYIDPPYNTGNDFIYHDDFSVSQEEYDIEVGVYDENDNRLFRNTETNGRFHSDWCSMLYSRLVLARNLLRDDGVIFISIDDNEVHNLRKLCDEVFGSSNFVAIFPWRKRTAKSDVPFGVSQDYEWLITFAKSRSFRASVEGMARKYYESDDFPGRPWRIHDMTKQTTASERPNSFFTMINPKNGDEFPCNPNATWRITSDTFMQYYNDNKIIFPGDYQFLKITNPVMRYFKDEDMVKAGDDFGRIALSTHLGDNVGMSQDGTKEIKAIFGSIPFSFPKNTKLLKYLMSAVSKNDDIILDFFSGSATTAHAVMQLNAEDGGNRKFIMVQLPEVCAEGTEAVKAGFQNICEIGKERIRRAGDKIKEENKDKPGIENLDIGFRVFKLDDSNMNNVYYSPEDYTQDMLAVLEDNIKPDRTDLDLLFGCLLEWALPLSMPHSRETVDGFTVHTYNDGDLIACFDKNISEKVIREIAKRKPMRAVFRDSGFESSPEKINVFEIFKLLAPNTTVKVI